MNTIEEQYRICERFSWEFDYFKICREVLMPTSVPERSTAGRPWTTGGPPLFNTKSSQFSVMSTIRAWYYTQQKRDFSQQELQKPQTALSRDAGLEQKLREFMRSGEDWERSRTSIPGVFVVKLPGRGSRGPELALEINPVDGQGQPKKKRGYMVRGKPTWRSLPGYSTTSGWSS
jgi:hypothetical protein